MASRDAEWNHIHPMVRAKVKTLVERLAAENIPFQVFEGFRSPERQRQLFAQGRTAPGAIVTRAKPWQSYHQYGLAADLVLRVDGQWSWDDAGPRAAWWRRMLDLAHELGLESLSWEKPHVQLPGLTLSGLQQGNYPVEGDETWAENLGTAILAWDGTPSAPPAPDKAPQRPPLVGAGPLALDISHARPQPAVEGWHSRFSGQLWRYDDRGIYLKSHEKGKEPLRTLGRPLTCRRIMELMGEHVLAMSTKYAVPAELILMVVATETGFAKSHGFTGPATFRWEPNSEVNDVPPERFFGNYSAGPMQTLATTARWLIDTWDLPLDPFETAPAFRKQPPPPAVHPLYDYPISLDLGTAYIRQNWKKTGADPVLVSAAYNAGSLRKTTNNPWGLVCFGDHLERAVKWYGDACAVMAEFST